MTIDRSPSFVVLNVKGTRVLYRADTLPQARGYTDGREGACLVASVVEMCKSEFLYQICMIDSESGQVVCRGPMVDLMEAPELLLNLRVAVLPVLDAAQTEAML